MEKIAKMDPINKWMLGGAAVGAGLGGTLGYLPDTKRVPTGFFSSKEVKTTKADKIGGAIVGTISGGVTGAILGSAVGIHRHPRAYEEEMRRRYSYKYHNSDHGGSYGGSYRKAGNEYYRSGLHDIHKDLQAPSSGFKTKKEATDHFRKMRAKHHPDRNGGSHEQMSKLNRAWDEYKKHPNGLEKLANAYLEKIARSLTN